MPANPFGLTAGTVDASGNLTPNDCLALDLAMSMMREKLEADSWLSSIFPLGRITRRDAAPDWFGLDCPHLAIYPISGDPQNVPGSVEMNEAEVFVSVIRSAKEVDRALDDWEPGITSVQQRIRNVLTAGGLVVTVNSQEALVATGTPGAASDFPVLDERGLRAIAVNETRWVLDVDVDNQTGYPCSVSALLP